MHVSSNRWIDRADPKNSALGLALFALLTIFDAEPVHGVVDIQLALGGQDLRILGRAADDQTGNALAVGDVNGDQIADILIGTLRSSALGGRVREKAGKVSVILGMRDLPAELNIEAAQRTFFGATAEARLGHAVAVGDINQDGIGDLIMAAPEAKSPHGEGAAYVFFGGDPLPAEANTDLKAVPADVTLWGDEQGGRLGNSLAVGDFNGDGRMELAVAGPRQGDDDGNRDAGRVYIFFYDPSLGLNSEVVARAIGFDAPYIMELRGARADDLLGQSLAAGDFNGDGITDLIMGATRTGLVEGPIPGEVLILFGGSHFKPGGVVELSNPSSVSVRIKGPDVGDRFAVALGTGNINGDGADDLLIGAFNAPFIPGFITGRAYAVLGRSFNHGTVIDLASTPADVTVMGPHQRAELGAAIAAADLNNDGFDEWIVGSPRADRSGQAYRIPGRALWPTRGGPGALTMGARPGDRAGDALAVGDVNGDGIADLVMSSPEFDGTSATVLQSGAVYVVLGVEMPVEADPCTDEDGDGLSPQGRTCGPIDCDDTNPVIDICLLPGCEGPDSDADGWPSTSDSNCPIADCDDNNSTVNPSVREICDNGIDDNCDTAKDRRDVDCGGPGPGGPPEPPPPPPPPPENCTNCVDDDLDGLRDLLDPDCAQPSLALRGKILGPGRTNPAMAERILIKTILPDDGIATAATPANDEETAPTITVGISITSNLQLCVTLDQIKRSKTTLTYRSEDPASKLKIKLKDTGRMRVKYKQLGPLELPDAEPDVIHFGVFNTPRSSYVGFSPLDHKSRYKFIMVPSISE
jgi:hypothetical protein